VDFLDLNDILSRAWDFTVKLTRDIGNLIILFVLNLIPIVDLVFVGYCARIIRLGDSIDEPPRMTGFWDAFVDGLKVFFAALIYAFIPLLIVGVSLFPLVFRRGMVIWQRFPLQVFFIGVALWGSLLATVIGFLLFIVGAMGIIHMIKTGSFAKAFAVTEILSLIGEVGWGRYLGWLIVMYILSLVVASLNSIHWIVFAIASVFYAVFVARSAHYIYPRRSELVGNPLGRLEVAYE